MYTHNNNIMSDCKVRPYPLPGQTNVGVAGFGGVMEKSRRSPWTCTARVTLLKVALAQNVISKSKTRPRLYGFPTSVSVSLSRVPVYVTVQLARKTIAARDAMKKYGARMDTP